jgi:hypothetical protein
MSTMTRDQITAAIKAKKAAISELENDIALLMETNYEEEPKDIRRIALLDAASEVAGHWNDKFQMCNQYEQAQKSASILQKMALAEGRNS